jgi:oxygen-independent coproporphyrinogen-3 oxidase
MIGLPGQTWDSLKCSIQRLLELGVDHLSVYCLSVEEGTPLSVAMPENLPSEDDQATFFEQASAMLTLHGLCHYEISNFAKTGQECIHNLNYWRGGEYLGLGPAAASHWNGKRFKNRADLTAYLQDPLGQVEAVERLDMRAKAAEEAMLRLRLLEEGVDVENLSAKYGKKAVAEIVLRLESMTCRGYLLKEGERYRLAPERVLTSNAIFADVLSD